MKNEIKTFFVTLMLFFSIILLSFGMVSSEENTITVDNNGDADFSTIQEAISYASPGDTIYVHSGTYYEHLTIDKAITINGENKETTIIDGENNGIIISVSAKSSDIVTLSNLTIQNSGSTFSSTKFDSGITNEESSLHLINNVFTNHEISAVMINSGFEVIIKDNLFKNCKMYALQASFIEESQITKNIFRGTGYGIYIITSHNTEISYNIFESGEEPSFAGLFTFSCDELMIYLNHFSSGSIGALSIDGADGSTIIMENNFVNSRPFFGKTNLASPFSGMNEMHEFSEKIIGKANTLSESAMFSILSKSYGLKSLSTGTSWNSNYYSDWNGRGRYMINGVYVFIIKIPFIVILPWATFDSNPSSEPYQIP